MRTKHWPQLLSFAFVTSMMVATLSLPALSVEKGAKPKGLDNASKKGLAYAQKDASPPTINAAGSNGPTTNATGKAHHSHQAPDPLLVAANVDELIAAELNKAGVSIAPRCNDEDFLRRASFDIAGVAPTPQNITLFGLDSNSHKRALAIDRLLAGSDYASNWSRYWYDVIAPRATETRLQFLFPALQNFESWMKSQLAANRPWDAITTDILTATGDIKEHGQTAFIISQRAEPDEVAAETSRIFMGIQLQCANCHDHPTDSWKREQFHSFAAFFPRMQTRPKGQPMTPQTLSLELASFSPDSNNGRGRGEFFKRISENPEQFIRRLDKDGDHKISREEAKQAPGGQIERLFDFGDANKDGFLTAAELKKIQPPQMMPPGRGAAEYHMPDLQHPQAEGKKLDPVFFLGNLKAGSGLSDMERRTALARYITSPGNPWFAKAFVNRIWGQLVGEGFYMPIDDIGPERTANHPAALDALSTGFTSSGYDIAWLFRAIVNTEAYQRQIRSRDPNQTIPFAAAAPARLRADLLYDSIATVLGFKEQDQEQVSQANEMPMGPYARRPNRRREFHQLFGFDPSTRPEEVNGTIPQALFMMNSGFVNSLIRATGQTRLHQLLDKYKNDDDAIMELFILVHAREPSAREAQTCRDYIREFNNRQEAFEDILWSLLNSTEFQSKR
jgi:hypothetical protein